LGCEVQWRQYHQQPVHPPPHTSALTASIRPCSAAQCNGLASLTSAASLSHPLCPSAAGCMHQHRRCLHLPFDCRPVQRAPSVRSLWVLLRASSCCNSAATASTCPPAAPIAASSLPHPPQPPACTSNRIAHLRLRPAPPLFLAARSPCTQYHATLLLRWRDYPELCGGQRTILPGTLAGRRMRRGRGAGWALIHSGADKESKNVDGDGPLTPRGTWTR
jgi:hypothetical protein